MVSTPPYKSKFTREQVQAELNRFYYDTAQVSLLGTLAALAKLVPVSQIVYGTDFPYRTAADHTKGVTSVFRKSNFKNWWSCLTTLSKQTGGSWGGWAPTRRAASTTAGTRARYACTQ